MKIVGAVLIVLSGSLSGWASDLSRDAAGPVVDKSLQRSIVAIELALGRVGANCADASSDVVNYDPTTAVVFVVAQKSGILNITPDGSGFWKVGLVDMKPGFVELLKKTAHKIAKGCDYQKIHLFVARRVRLEVVSVTQRPDAVEVQYSWKWESSQSFAKLPEQLSAVEQKDLEDYFSKTFPFQSDQPFKVADMNQDAKPYTTRRTFKNSDDGWSLAFDQNVASDVINRKLARESKDFAVPIGKVGMHCGMMVGGKENDENLDPENYISMTVLKKAGYVSVVPEEIGSWRVSLTERGQSAQSRASEPNTLEACNFRIVTFPVATQSLVKVVAIHGGDDAPEVEYLWKWTPTGLGVSLRTTGDVYAKLNLTERAALRKYLAETILSPALSLPVPSGPPANLATPGKVQLRRDGSGWIWQ